MTYYNKDWKVTTAIPDYKPDLRRAEPYVDDDGIYMPVHEYFYEGVPAEYKMIMSKELFQEAFKEYILKEGLLNVQSKEQKNRGNNSST